MIHNQPGAAGPEHDVYVYQKESDWHVSPGIKVAECELGARR
jgi:hypothetical protein